ncbi:MAG: ComEC/Rec2 family competence protein [Eubacterium sp.]|nr:ComEC/Rec2 family competence protein [Eubacterium sp.]
MVNRPLCIVLVLFVVGICLWHTFSHNETFASEEKNMTLEAEVETIKGGAKKQSLVVRNVVSDGRVFCDKLVVYQDKEADLFAALKLGNTIRVTGDFLPLEPAGNEGQFDEVTYYESQGIQGKFYTKSIHILNSEYLIIPQKIYELRSAFYRIITEHMPAETAGVLSAMMLGEKSSLDETVKELYTKSGIGHILAISGLHISLIGAGLFFLLRRYVMPMRASAVTVIFLLILYAELTGFSIATKRAVVMMIVMLVARIIGEAYDGYNALALSALIELLGHPDNLFQAGFLLSYGTALGVLVFMNFWNRAIDKNVYQYFLGNLGMVIMTLPIVLSFYYEINLLSFVVNSLILPF